MVPVCHTILQILRVVCEMGRNVATTTTMFLDIFAAMRKVSWARICCRLTDATYLVVNLPGVGWQSCH
jgi:hypothetical protein